MEPLRGFNVDVSGERDWTLVVCFVSRATDRATDLRLLQPL